MRSSHLLLLLAACGAGSEFTHPSSTAESVEVQDAPATDAPQEARRVALAPAVAAPAAAPAAPSHFQLVEPAFLPTPTSRSASSPRAFPDPSRLITPRRIPFRAFRSTQELRRFARADGTMSATGSLGSAGFGGMGFANASMGTVTRASSNTTASSNGPAESITNTQVAGIDEGDIVKTVGEHFVILRRGVLYSLSVQPSLVVEDQIHVQPPDQGEGWIDELLVHQGTRTLIVTGFVVAPDGREYTLYHLFTLEDDGRIVRGDAIFFPSYDYFDEENYATRMIGDDLVAYSIHPLNGDYQLEPDELEGLEAADVARARSEARFDYHFPQVRRGPGGRFERTWSPRRIFREEGRVSSMLHAITSCRMNTVPIRCQTRGVLADGYARLFVSSSAAYLWMNSMSYVPESPNSDEYIDSMASPLYRFPHRRNTVQSVAVAGEVQGALSFRESEDSLQALVYVGDVLYSDPDDSADDDAAGDAPDAELALVTIPLRSFGQPLRWSDYRPLPGSHCSSVRFVGEHVLYGERSAFVHNLETGTTVVFDEVTPGRIDPLGSDAALVSWNESSSLQYALIDVEEPSSARERRALRGATSSETRTHGFFYQPDPSGGSFGMPVVSNVGPSTLAQVAYFDVRDQRSTLVGSLSSASRDDTTCENSCVDWYGNARPIFWRERVFALLGSVLVEGARVNGRVAERGRVALVPEPAAD